MYLQICGNVRVIDMENTSNWWTWIQILSEAVYIQTDFIGSGMNQPLPV